MQTFRFYSALPATTNARIDRQNAILRGVTAMQAGVEAIGHGVQADLQTLYSLAAMGNANPKGIRGRFGHPAISENATGKQVQVAKNFRVEGDNLVHDSHLLQTARKSPVFSQDPVEFLLGLAEDSPSEFGESVVIEADLVWTLDDGTETDAVVPDEDGPLGGYIMADRPKSALTPLPVLRPLKFHYVDVVNEGALTHDGLFPASAQMAQMFFAGHSSEFADQIFQTVDAWRERYQIPLSALPEKVEQVVDTYMALRQKERTMRKKYTMEQEPVDAVIDTPVDGSASSPTEQFESDPVDDKMAELDAKADALANRKRDLSSDTRMQQALAKIEVLEDRVQHMTDLLMQCFDETTAMADEFEAKVIALQNNYQTLQRNYKRLNGETDVTVKVPTARHQPLEQTQQYAHPTPANGFAMAANLTTQLTERGNEYGVTATDSPAVAAAKQQVARNRQIGR